VATLLQKSGEELIAELGKKSHVYWDRKTPNYRYGGHV